MTITIINDCRDTNTANRQFARASSLLRSPAMFVGVASDLEASGNLIDTLDALENREGVILANVAPRNGAAKKWPNGTPFGYFLYKNVLVVASIDGLTLSLVKKLHLVDEIHVLDIPVALGVLAKNADISAESEKYIADSQFRSYDFLPRIAAYLLKHRGIESTPLNISEIVDTPPAIWWIDNFGNCKTTLWAEEIIPTAENKVATVLGELPYYPRLKDVPDKAAAIIVGSSGINDTRFLEIIVQGESAADHFTVSSGDRVL
jgi:hypothetical protein